MVNTLLQAMAKALRKEFSEGYPIYTEEVEQGLQEPCFFIECLQQKEERKLDRRFFAEQTFVVTYFPKKGKEECWAVQNRLQCALQSIFLEDGSSLRGTHRSGKIVDGILHFFVDYNFPLIIRKEAEETMEVLQIYGKTRE